MLDPGDVISGAGRTATVITAAPGVTLLFDFYCPDDERRADLRASLHGRSEHAPGSTLHQGIVRVGDALQRRDPRHRRPLLRQRHHLLQRRHPRPRAEQLRMRRQRLASRLAREHLPILGLHQAAPRVADGDRLLLPRQPLGRDLVRHPAAGGVVDIRNSRFVHNGRAGFTWEVSGDSTPGDHALPAGKHLPRQRLEPQPPFGSGGHAGIIISDSANIEITGNTFQGNLALDTNPAPAPCSCTTAPATHSQCTTSQSTTTPSTRTGSKPTAPPPAEQQHNARR